jgi:hypothetical protein
MIARRRPVGKRRSKRHLPAVPRDQRDSAFTSILAGLVDRVPGARAAALVDRDGETVDYWGELDSFALRLAAAHWRLVLDELGRQHSFQTVRWLVWRGSGVGYLVHELPEEYALVVVLARAAGFFGWRRAIASCARALGDEAGWDWVGLRWFPAEVTADERRRPSWVRVGDRSYAVEILGAIASGLARRERGWRVRFASGVEATLVREPGGVWYCDEPLEDSRPQAAPGGPEKRR